MAILTSPLEAEIHHFALLSSLSLLSELPGTRVSLRRGTCVHLLLSDDGRFRESLRGL